MPTTKKQCPGCKRSGHEVLREAGEVCSLCRKKLRDYDRIANAETADKIQATVGQFACNNEYYHISGRMGRSNSDLSYALREAIHAVAMRASEQYPEALNDFNYKNPLRLLGKTNEIYSAASRRLIKKDLAEAIVRLHRMIKTCLLVSYKNGYRDGREIMFDLAAGDITINELNKLSLRIENEEDA